MQACQTRKRDPFFYSTHSSLFRHSRRGSEVAMGPNPVLRSISAFYAMTVYNISFIRDEGRKDEHSLSILTIRLHNLAILLFCFCFAFPPPPSPSPPEISQKLRNLSLNHFRMWVKLPLTSSSSVTCNCKDITQKSMGSILAESSIQKCSWL